jgi:hypothetical protein
MAFINTIETEGIQVGLAGAAPLASVDVWQSLDPTRPFAFQTTGVSNLNGLTNQLGVHNAFSVSNAFGSHLKFGISQTFGGKFDLGFKVDAIKRKKESTPSWTAASPFGKYFGKLNVIGGLFKNGVPVETISDIKVKTNIKPLENSLEKVLKLQGVEYDRIDIERHEIGMIAQEVEKIVPDLVQEDSEGFKILHYKNATALLVEAIKEQQEQINTLKQTVQELSTKLAECCP